MFLAIDRVSKFAYVEFHDSAGKMEGSAFLNAVVKVFPLPNPHRAHRRTAFGDCLAVRQHVRGFVNHRR
jgi:hypothetical protein